MAKWDDEFDKVLAETLAKKSKTQKPKVSVGMKQDIMNRAMASVRDKNIAPVSSASVSSRVTDRMTTKTDNKKKKKWYEDGLFEDGYDVGDVTKTILGIDEDSASLKDLTVNSLKRGYYNSLYGEETYKAMNGQKNQKDAYKKLLESDEYQFTPGNDFAGGVSGAFEQVGQMFRQYTNPRTLAIAGGAAGAAAIAGQAGPQVLLPEEIVTVPAAAAAGFAAGSAASSLEIEAGHAYNEMIELGVKEDIARKIAMAVGVGNAGLEAFQVDELSDAYKATAGKGATKTFAKILVDELKERGVDVLKETAQEDLQELVTIGGVQAAHKLDKGEYAYSAEEIGKRLLDTTKSSLLSFGMMNVPAAAKNTFSTLRDQKIANSKNDKVVEAPFAEKAPVAEQKPVVENAPVVEQTQPEVKPKRVLYTGSPNTDIKQFKVGGGERQTGDRYGRGIYLTTNEGTAKNYAGENGRVYQTNVDDLNVFNLNDKITPEMKENLVSGLRETDPQYRNSVLRNFRTEQTFDDLKSAENFFVEQQKSWKEQDGQYEANKPVVKSVDNKTGKAVIEFTDFANWENVIGDLTGSQLYDALKSLSTDDFSSFITANGFDGISFDEDADNQQFVIYRNEDRIRIDEDAAEKATSPTAAENAMVENANVAETENIAPNSTQQQETQLSEDNSTAPDELQKLYDERDELNRIIDSYVADPDYTNNDHLQEAESELRFELGLVNEKIEAYENKLNPKQTVSESENVAPEQKGDTKSKFVPKTVKQTAAQSVFKGRALDVESLSNSAKEKIKGRYKALERATEVATDLLMHGNENLRPIHQIFEDISKIGDVEDFNSYIYHKLNPERIAQDKDVHRGVSSEESQAYVKHLAENNPEFEKFAQEIYDWCDYLLNLQVESKRITQETADKFKSMYPSYAPIRRSGFPDDLHILDVLGLILENQGNLLEMDFAEDVVDAAKQTDPLTKKTTGGEKPILPLADTLAERVVQIHWTAAFYSDMFDDAAPTSKPKHALYVDDVLQYVDNFDNPFTESDFTFEKRNDYHMRKRFSKEELSRLTKETKDLIARFANGEMTPADRAKLNENYVLHDLQVIRSKMSNLNKWLDRINGELAYQKEELSILNRKKRDLKNSIERSQDIAPNGSVDHLMAEYDKKIAEFKKQIRENEIKLRNATAYVKKETDDNRVLEETYVGMLSMEKPIQQGSNYSSGTTFTDSSNQVAPESFAVEETFEAETQDNHTVKYDEPKFTKPKDAKFDFDGKDKKLGRLSMFMNHIVDKGAIFEKVAKETKNEELDAKWDFIRKTYNATQHLIGKGVDGVKSLNNVFTEVDKLGVSEEFQNYLRLMAHWDGMTVKMRYGFPKNRTFLNTDMEAYKAKEQAMALEKKYPQFAKLADDIYQNMALLRSEMVDAGLMTQKDADFIAEVYPHFIPVRYDQDGNPVSVFDSIAVQMLNVKRSCATNKFSGELLGTLNSAVPQEGIDSYDILSRFAGSPKMFELGEFGNYPTYTFYDNGRKVNYAVSIQMKEALKDTHPALNARIPGLATANDVFRALTTEYNVPFHFSNAIRDAKSVLLNSHHAVETYKNIPRAYKEILSNGKYYQEYLENGGGSNTYFDTKKREFTSSKGSLRDIPPLAQISRVGNVIESATRLADYIASREQGKSIEVSMLGASRVTTNFGAGGDVTKFIDRNGATFLNASVQGFAQTVRNFQEAKMNGLMGYGVLAAKLMLSGLPHAILDKLIWEDDEDYQNLPDYIKESYDIIAKTNSGRFIRIPKDRTQACIDNAFDQITGALTGDDDIDLLEFGRIFLANLAPNNPLDDNLFAPVRQVMNNKAWYGDELVPTRLQELPEAEQFDDKTDAISRYLGETFDYSPYKINYLLNNYGGGLADVVLPFLTPRAESGSDSFIGKLLNPFRDKFSTDPVLNNRVTDDFYDKVDELKAVANSADATEEDKLISSYMISESSAISDLWEKRREIQSSDLPDSTKFERMREIKEEINRRMFDALDSYENVKVTGKYATVGGHRFNKDDSGKWWELTPKKSDGTDNGYYTNEQDHLKVLGITPEQYWNNQEYYHEQYNTAIYRPGEYALTKVFGGYDDYMNLTKDWSDLVTGKNEKGEWNTTVNKKEVGNIIYNLNIPEIEKHILYKSIYNYTDTHNREILEYIDNRGFTWDEMKKIVIELGFTVDENNRIHWD